MATLERSSLFDFFAEKYREEWSRAGLLISFPFSPVNVSVAFTPLTGVYGSSGMKRGRAGSKGENKRLARADRLALRRTSISLARSKGPLPPNNADGPNQSKGRTPGVWTPPLLS